jgi:hypothetical protein
MNQLLVFFAVAIFVVIAIKVAQVLYDKMEKQSQTNNQPKQELFCESSEIVYSIPNNDYKEVLKKENCSSSRKPYRDYNDKQNLTQYNHGTYRDIKGRFQSTKKWKKEQNHS